MTQITNSKHISNLGKMLKAKSLAIVGISGREESFGWQVYDNLKTMGYEGKIYGVNPGYETLFGQKVYASMSDLPETPDCVALALSNTRLLPALKEAASLNIPSAVIYASAYGEDDGKPLETELIRIAKESGMAICGPNCMGFVSFDQKFPVYGYPAIPGKSAGNITLISHSGSVWDALLQNNRGVNFNYVISAGNEMVTTMADYMHFALSEKSTKIIALYLETVRDPDSFREALQSAAEKDIPVIALKVGRSEKGKLSAQAHTGALAGEDETYDALFSYYGVQRVHSLDEMMDTMELFASGARPSKSKLASIHDSGGELSLLLDLAADLKIDFAKLAPPTVKSLEDLLEPGVKAENPLDAYGTGNYFEEVYSGAIKAFDRDPNIGLTILVADLYPANVDPPTYGTVVIPLKNELVDPLIVLSNVSATAAPFKTSAFRDAGIPVLMGTETGLRAVAHLFDYTDFQRKLQNSGRIDPKSNLSNLPTKKRISEIRKRLSDAIKPLDEVESKQILSAYGISTSQELIAEDYAEVENAAKKITFPIALKTLEGTNHKTEVGGIHLNLNTSQELAEAYQDLESRLGPRVVVQEMIPDGVELIMGIVNDPQFGSQLMIGIGGVFVELLNDAKLIWLPTNTTNVKAALLELKLSKILRGVRGKEKSDIDAIVETALRLGQLANDCGDLIAELDINPLIAGPNGVVAVDALIIPKSGETQNGL